VICINHIGLAVTSPGGLNRFTQLERALDFARELDYTMVELNPAPYALIINGELNRRSLADFVAVLRNFNLRYSLHGLPRLNLAYDMRHELCKRIMACQIEICRLAKISILVYHSGLQALDELRYGMRSAPLTDDELQAGADREVSAFRELAVLAADAGVTIGMENGDPHLWEYALLKSHGLPRTLLPKHHARLQIEPIVRQLEAIDHPNVGLTLDVAHLYIAAHELNFDYLAAIEAAAPWVKHLHANDNFGKLDSGVDQESDRWAFGEADAHLPPGWGTIPFRNVFERLSHYHGDLILEIKPGFADYFAESLHTMKALLEGKDTF
jgi:sugar phosphate isomerase/epimerase